MRLRAIMPYNELSRQEPSPDGFGVGLSTLSVKHHSTTQIKICFLRCASNGPSKQKKKKKKKKCVLEHVQNAPIHPTQGLTRTFALH